MTAKTPRNTTEPKKSDRVNAQRGFGKHRWSEQRTCKRCGKRRGEVDRGHGVTPCKGGTVSGETSRVDAVDIEHARATLTACLRFFRERAEESSYGYFCGEDPRTFSPDFEVCTAAEIAAHRAACAAWERGERPDRPRRKVVTIDEAEAMLAAGQADAATLDPAAGLASVQPSGWGMGVTVFVDDDMRDMAEQCEQALARLGGPTDAE